MVSAESMGSQTINNEAISERMETWKYGDKRKEGADLMLNKSLIGAGLKHMRPNMLVGCGSKMAVWCDGEYVIVRFKKASLLATAGEGEERGVVGHGVREGVDATVNSADEANPGAVQKSAASGGCDNFHAELVVWRAGRSMKPLIYPTSRIKLEKRLRRCGELFEQQSGEKHSTKCINEIHASLDESGKQHVGMAYV
ncbi:uncharacterized protein DS421_4g123140 [Arachis hypogaea]|nr:uncharacterized protein DS421_4g123140 [Arachis hypogaea]